MRCMLKGRSHYARICACPQHSARTQVELTENNGDVFTRTPVGTALHSVHGRLRGVRTKRACARIRADTLRRSVVMELIENSDGVYTTHVSASVRTAPLRTPCGRPLYPVFTIQQTVVQPVAQPVVSCKQTSNRLSNWLYSRLDNRLDVCLHDAAGRPTGCSTDLTTGCIV